MPRPLSKQTQDLHDTYSKWKAEPTSTNYQELSTKLEPVVGSAMHSFAGDDPGLQVRARILTAQAVHSYDPGQGAALHTHVYNNLQRLQRYRAERGRAVHIPEGVRGDQAAISRYVTEHTDAHGVEPSDIQISDKTGLSLRRIARSRTGGEVSESASEGEKGDLQGVRGRSAEEIWSDYVYHDLDERNRKIMEWTTGYNRQPVLKKNEIAAKLGISPAAVSQRINQIMSKMREGQQ